MTSILGSETHRYDFDESSGLIQDKVGSVHATLTRGAPDYNPSRGSVIYDGGDDGHRWLNAPFDISADMTFYVKLRILDSTSGTVIRFYGGDTFDRTPIGQWNDLADGNQLNVDTRGDGSGANLRSDIGRNATNTEIIVLLWSYVVSTKTGLAVFKSNEGIDENTTAVGSNGGLVDFFDLAESFGEFGNIEVFQMGSFNVAHPLSDMQDAADELLLEGLTFEQIQKIKRQLIVTGSRKLRV